MIGCSKKHSDTESCTEDKNMNKAACRCGVASETKEDKNMAKAATIHIDPAKFADRVSKDADTGENIFSEGDVLKFLIDQMNEAGVDIAIIYHDHELAIVYHGKQDYFSMPIASLDAPEGTVKDGMVELSDMLNDREDLKSWIEYQHGLYYLHIDEKEV